MRKQLNRSYSHYSQHTPILVSGCTRRGAKSCWGWTDPAPPPPCQVAPEPRGERTATTFYTRQQAARLWQLQAPGGSPGRGWATAGGHTNQSIANEQFIYIL